MYTKVCCTVVVLLLIQFLKLGNTECINGHNYPHVEDSHFFYKYVQGLLKLHECCEGSYFNPVISRCDFQDYEASTKPRMKRTTPLSEKEVAERRVEVTFTVYWNETKKVNTTQLMNSTECNIATLELLNQVKVLQHQTETLLQKVATQEKDADKPFFGGFNHVVPASWGPGRYDIFGVAYDGSVWQKIYERYKWSEWIPLHGSANSKPCAYSIKYNWIDVLYTGTDQKMYRKTWNGIMWNDWTSDPNDLLFLSAPAITSSDENELHVFGIGTNTSLYHSVINILTNKWSPWESLSGICVGDPAAVSWGPGRYDAFVVGTDLQLWQTTYDNGWKRFASVSGGLFKTGITAVSKQHGQMSVFLKGTNDLIYHREYINGNWKGYEQLGSFTEKILSSPSAVSVNSSSVDLFVVGVDHAIYHHKLGRYVETNKV